MDKILNRNKFLNYKKVNEEAPFANDIAWGDSIIGRLINSIARKSKIAINKRRISGLVSLLKSTFDEMIEVMGSDINSKDLRFLNISSLLGVLKSQVENGEDVDLLISTTSSLIDAVKSYDFEKKDIMIDALEKFLEYLKGLNSGSSTEDDSEMDSKKSGEIKEESFYKRSRHFLQSIVDLESDIKNNVVKISTGSENVNTFFNLEKFNSLLSKIENRNNKDKSYPLTGRILKDFRSKDISYQKSIVDQLLSMVKNGFKVAESRKDKKNMEFFDQYIKKYSGYSPTKSTKDEDGESEIDFSDVYKPDNSRNKSVAHSRSIAESNSNLAPIESHAKNAWKKVLDAYKTSGISNYTKYISELLSADISDGKEKYLKSKQTIVDICKQVVMNKSTVGNPISYENLIKEQHSVNDISKSISLFSRYLLPYSEDQGLWASYGIAGKHLKTLIDSFSSLSSLIKPVEVSDKKEDSDVNKEEKKNEIAKYEQFLLIREKNEFSDQIKSKFDEIFTSEITSFFDITEEKRSKLESNVKKSEDFVFTTADPIIEIVRICNRAWRIHTPGVIPSGRTGGKVSNSVFREYENMGSGSGTPDAPGSGPYRNIELYETWNSAVQDILSDVKYRPLFSENVKFKFNSVETGKSGDDIKKGGKILLKFVNRLASDSQMYSDKGAITKFVEEYFGLSRENKEYGHHNWSYSEFPKDAERNFRTTSNIPTSNVKFVRWKPDMKFFEGNNKTIFRFKTEREDKVDIWYCKYLFKDKAAKYAYVLYSLNGMPYDMSKARFENDRPLNTANHVYFGKIAISDIVKKSNWEITNVDIESNMDSNDVKKIEPFVSDLSILTDDSGKYFKGIGRLFGKHEYKRITSDFLKKNIDRLK